MIKVQKIATEGTYKIRHKILRPHQTLQECQYPGDHDSTTAHFGAFKGADIVGVLSIYKIQHRKIDISDSWQLRAMATKESIRGKGHGLRLLRKAESHALKYGGKCIWANSRSGAVGFYKKSGYSIIGNEFNISGIGLHHLVCKKLT